MIEALQKMGAEIVACDPAAIKEAEKIMAGVTFHEDPYETVEGADAMILMTEWNPYRNLDLDRIKKGLKSPIIIDLRNIYDPKRMADLGFQYTSVGRPGEKELEN